MVHKVFPILGVTRLDVKDKLVPNFVGKILRRRAFLFFNSYYCYIPNFAEKNFLWKEGCENPHFIRVKGHFPLGLNWKLFQKLGLKFKILGVKIQRKVELGG